MVNPRKKPEFARWVSKSLKRIKSSWRKPRGIQSKIRERKLGKLKMPLISYGAPRKLRYLHPSGRKEVLVYNAADLQKIDTKNEAVRIGASVGRKKRTEIVKKAQDMNLKILNPVIQKQK